MANWITHMMIAERLIARGLDVDARGFCAGSIAPDCNVENADWSAFDPPREVTHFMTGSGKDTADHAGFFDRYIRGRDFSSEEERGFFLGYYAHLVTDAEFHMFIHGEKQVAAVFARLKKAPELQAQVAGLPETFDTLKAAFGRGGIYKDYTALEQAHVRGHAGCMYSMLRGIREFPDHFDLLPAGAIARKIPLMTEDKPAGEFAGIFVTEGEYEGFIECVCTKIYAALKAKK